MTLYIDLKPTLEWVEFHGAKALNNQQFSSHSLFGEYIITSYGVGRQVLLSLWYPSYYSDDSDNDLQLDYATIEEAKAAAQADYERRTAERFRPITLPDRMNARQGDGSVHYCTGWNDVLDAIAKARGEV